MVPPPNDSMSPRVESNSAAHVVLRSVLNFEEEDSQLRFDEATRRLILIQHRQVVALSLNSLLQPLVVQSHGKVENVRFSLNLRFAAIQRSDTVIDFIDLHSGTSFLHTCKGGKTRWRILTYQWTGSPVADFVVVTTSGVEFYIVLPDKGSLKLIKMITLATSWAVYSHATRMLLLATGPQDNVLHGVQIQPNTLVRLPKFEVQLAPHADPVRIGALFQSKLRRSLLPGDVSIVRLYESIFCVHVEPERQQAFLYQLFKDVVIRKYALSIYSSRAVVSVSDNLLVVHALDSKVALIFDLRINQQFPITAPLPLATLADDGFSPLYSPHWTLASPDLIIDPQAGRVGQLQIDLHTIVHSSVDKPCLLQFLLERTHCAEVILEVFRKSIAEVEDLHTLSRMFNLLHAALARQLLARRASGTASGSPASAASRSSSNKGANTMTSSVSSEYTLSTVDRGSASMSAASSDASQRISVSEDASFSPLEAAPAVASAAAAITATGSSIAASASSPLGSSGAADADSQQPASGDSSQTGDSAVGSPSPLAATASASASELPFPTDADASANAFVTAAAMVSSAKQTEAAVRANGELPSTPPAAPSQARAYPQGPPDTAAFLERVLLPMVLQLPHPPNARSRPRQYAIAVLTEFLHSQQQYSLATDPAVGTLIFMLLAEQRSFYQLHQLVQFHLVPDSIELATGLMGLKQDYPPAAELAIDMLKRLRPGVTDALMRTLIDHDMLLAACRLIRSQRLLTYPARPLLAAAIASGDAVIFASVLTHFEQRNDVWRGSRAFLPEEQCDEFVQRYDELFCAPDTTAYGPLQMGREMSPSLSLRASTTG